MRAGGLAIACLVCALLAVKGSADLPVSKGKMVEYPLNSRLFYAFDLKVAHHETELPAAKVRPQTPLEDIGLYPFLYYRGYVSLDFHCQPENTTDTLVEVSVSSLTLDCGVEPFYTTSYCERQQVNAHNIMTYSMWMVMSYNGTITSVYFADVETPVARSFKRQLISELSLTNPHDGNTTNYMVQAPRWATVPRDQTSTTRYRVSPFTRHSGSTGSVDGLIIRREKAIAKTDSNSKIRDVWSYMVIGGELDAASGIKHVPTRVVVLAQSEAKLKKKNQKITSSGSLFWLRHTQLSLRRVLPINVNLNGPTCVLPPRLVARPAPLP